MKDNFQEIIKKLETFPSICQKIEILWGTQTGRDYLDDLCIDDRCEVKPRQGFPFLALLAIEELLDLHDSLYPQFVKGQTVWNTII
jgi:hypothetical protein